MGFFFLQKYLPHTRDSISCTHFPGGDDFYTQVNNKKRCFDVRGLKTVLQGEDFWEKPPIPFLQAVSCSCSKNIMARDCRDCLLSTLLIQALKFHIACDMSAKEVHDLGQKEVKRIRSRMDEVRKSRVSCGEIREIRALADPS